MNPDLDCHIQHHPHVIFRWMFVDGSRYCTVEVATGMQPGKTFEFGKSLVQKQQGHPMTAPPGPSIEAALEAVTWVCRAIWC